MPITNIKKWNEIVAKNQDPYSKACVDVARRAMQILDEEQDKPVVGGYDDPMSTHKIICRADDESGAGGITGAMAGFVAHMVSGLHSRGHEFRLQWNKQHGVDDEKETRVVNPAIMTIDTDK